MKSLIIISAPIGAGKTVLTQHLANYYSFETAECKEKLHKLTMEFFDVPEDVYWNTYTTRKLKETPNALFTITKEYAHKLSILLDKPELAYTKASQRATVEGKVMLSLREAMIFVSEIICKPVFGQDYFGVCRANKICESSSSLFVDDSAFGTFDEIQAVYDLLGDNNILVLRVYGRGDYTGDSRKYLEDKRLTNCHDLWNDVDIEDFLEQGLDVVEKFLGERGEYMQNELDEVGK